MDRHPSIEKPPRLWRRLALTGTLLLAACTDSTDSSVPETTRDAAATTTVTTTQAAPTVSGRAESPTTITIVNQCSLTPVSIGEFFNPAKAGEITRQIDLVNTLADQSRPFGASAADRISNVNAAGEVVFRAFRDPMYADAMDKAIDSAIQRRPLTREQFLAQPIPRPQPCSDNRLTKADSSAHYDDLQSVSGFVLEESGRRLADQTVSLTKESIDAIRRQVDQWLQDMGR